MKLMLKLFLALFLVNFAVFLIPTQEDKKTRWEQGIHSNASGDIVCPDGFAYQIPEPDFYHRYVRCEDYDQFYKLFHGEKDLRGAEKLLLN